MSTEYDPTEDNASDDVPGADETADETAGGDPAGDKPSEAPAQAARAAELRERRRMAREQMAARAARYERTSRRRRWLVGVGVVAVAAAAVAVVVVRSRGDDGSRPANPAIAGPAWTAMSVAQEKLTKVGKGAVTARPLALTGQPALTDGGKPLVLYVGAEYCPYCAAQRWAMVVALARFGTFQEMRAVSAGGGGGQILTFHGAKYTSDHIAFQGVELADPNHAALQALTPAQEELVRKYDAPPYQQQGSEGAVPFTDFGNEYLLLGASLDVTPLQYRSAKEIANELGNTNSPVAQAVLGAANMITAIICKITKGQPGSVCDSPSAKVYAEALTASAK